MIIIGAPQHLALYVTHSPHMYVRHYSANDVLHVVHVCLLMHMPVKLYTLICTVGLVLVS